MTKSEDCLRDLFPNTKQLEKCRFSQGHRIILQLAPTSLESMLALSTARIDDTDRSGRTSLSWAAERGDLESVRILLRYGADPNITDDLGMSALLYASGATRRDALLSWKQDPVPANSCPGYFLRDVLVKTVEDRTLIRLLLRHGAEWKIPTGMYGCTVLYVLTYLANRNFGFPTEVAGSKGLDTQMRDRNGCTPRELLQGGPDGRPEWMTLF